MFEQPQHSAEDEGFNQFLVGEVPTGARRILLLGCGRGRLGWQLKQQHPDRTVIGIEADAESAEVARGRLDGVQICDLREGFPAIEAASIDCIVFGDVIEQLLNPETVLRRARELLSPDGVILVSVANLGHFSMIKALLRADPMYRPGGPLEAAHLRYFSHATFIKLLLDAGLLPDLRRAIGSGGTEQVIPAATPLLEYVGVDPGRALTYLDSYRYLFAATAYEQDEPAVTPLTFVACVNDEDQLNSNLLRSPCLGPGSPHQLLMYRGQSSAADGLHAGLSEAVNDLVVLVQQDMYLPRGWDRQFAAQFRVAELRFGALGVAGLFGLRFRQRELAHVGRIIDRDQLLDYDVGGPADVDVLDEVLLAVRASSGLRADPSLGFHLYGADLCFRAQRAGLTNVVLQAPAFHNSLFARPSLSFQLARLALLESWPDIRPMHTNMGQLDTMQAPDTEPEPAPGPEPRADDARGEQTDGPSGQLNAVRRELQALQASRTWRLRGALLRVLRRR